MRMISTSDSCKGEEFFADVVKMDVPETLSWRCIQARSSRAKTIRASP
jgi:hypothetical protein